MKYQSNHARRHQQQQHRWSNPSADVLAANLMLVSISEDSSEDFVGFQSRYSPVTGGSGSDLSNGWGSPMTRKLSYKADLSSLAASPSSMEAMNQPEQFASNDDEQQPSQDDSWGFFMCA